MDHNIPPDRQDVDIGACAQVLSSWLSLKTFLSISIGLTVTHDTSIYKPMDTRIK